MNTVHHGFRWFPTESPFDISNDSSILAIFLPANYPSLFNAKNEIERIPTIPQPSGLESSYPPPFYAKTKETRHSAVFLSLLVYLWSDLIKITLPTPRIGKMCQRADLGDINNV